MYERWFLKMFFVPFSQGSGSFLYVFFIVIHFSTLIAVDDIAFAVLGVLILRSDQKLLDGSTSLEACLYPISVAISLRFSPSPCT